MNIREVPPGFMKTILEKYEEDAKGGSVPAVLAKDPETGMYNRIGYIANLGLTSEGQLVADLAFNIELNFDTDTGKIMSLGLCEQSKEDVEAERIASQSKSEEEGEIA